MDPGNKSVKNGSKKKKQRTSAPTEDSEQMNVLIFNAEEPSEVSSYIFDASEDTSKLGRWFCRHMAAHKHHHFHNLGGDEDGGLMECYEDEDENAKETGEEYEDRLEEVLDYLRGKCTDKNSLKLPIGNIHKYISIIQA